eukprot:19841-Rhodomonas_salina.1
MPTSHGDCCPPRPTTENKGEKKRVPSDLDFGLGLRTHEGILELVPALVHDERVCQQREAPSEA